MVVFIATVSILVIAALAWILNKFLRFWLRSGQSFRICPICAGVSGTWLWMLALKFFGYDIDLVIPAMLMGGSVVGIAYQVEKRLPHGRSSLFWKTFFIPIGFAAVYGILNQEWSVALITLIVLLSMTFLFLVPGGRTDSEKGEIKTLEKKMKDCC